MFKFTMCSLLFLSFSLNVLARDQASNFVTEEELGEIFHPVDPEIIPSELIIVVDKAKQGKTPTAQTMQVFRKKKDSDVLEYEEVFKWDVSTASQTLKKPEGGARYYAGTPIGAHRISLLAPGKPRMEKLHKSQKWNDAEMPYTIFFHNGIALHGTTPEHFSALGTRDSGGCVRMHPDNAKKLYNYILENLRPTTVTSYSRGGQAVRSAKGYTTQNNLNVMIVIVNRDKDRPLEH